ncbi:DUF3955 domain-containing protein [Listeria sp. PSOL-1]|uniref:DUF3955 domain-containing protein n=1 Tax=Listeria sp. PSOL-1 TaxID=1844999 RepID=UPI0013D4BF5A|nr:DUF3955 domain-containing protein [Listeria sp. PSOL-1]
MKKIIFPISLLIIAVILPLIELSGRFDYLDENNVLHENGFFSVQLAVLLFTTGLIWLVIICVRSFFNKKKLNKAS